MNDAGIVATLLNRTPPRLVSTSPSVCSRGLIVPQVLSCRSVPRAVQAAASLDVSSFNPFCLLVANGTSVATVTSDGRTMTVQFIDPSTPCMLTSSSLGDALVTAPRTALFEDLVLTPFRAGDISGAREGQTRFHAHSWPERRALSVVMSRPDACTVSRTIIDVSRSGIELVYDSLDGRAPKVESFAARTGLATWSSTPQVVRRTRDVAPSDAHDGV